jgi:hypothetical protein
MHFAARGRSAAWSGASPRQRHERVLVREPPARDTRYVAVALVGLGLVGILAILTSVGQRRRGRGIASATVAGIFFPVTWAVWYVRDEHPYRAAHHH